jgi:hypothetical protein
VNWVKSQAAIVAELFSANCLRDRLAASVRIAGSRGIRPLQINLGVRPEGSIDVDQNLFCISGISVQLYRTIAIGQYATQAQLKMEACAEASTFSVARRDAEYTRLPSNHPAGSISSSKLFFGRHWTQIFSRDAGRTAWKRGRVGGLSIRRLAS